MTAFARMMGNVASCRFALSPHFCPKLLHFPDKFVRFHSKTRRQHEDCRDAGLALVALQQRNRGGVKTGQLGQFLMR